MYWHLAEIHKFTHILPSLLENHRPRCSHLTELPSKTCSIDRPLRAFTLSIPLNQAHRPQTTSLPPSFHLSLKRIKPVRLPTPLNMYKTTRLRRRAPNAVDFTSIRLFMPPTLAVLLWRICRTRVTLFKSWLWRADRKEAGKAPIKGLEVRAKVLIQSERPKDSFLSLEGERLRSSAILP